MMEYLKRAGAAHRTRGLAMLGLALGIGLIGEAQGQEPEVTLELRIPPAETHVIGDPTPLFFRFVNRSDAPLGFLWEGCCRLNGRLEVTRDGAALDLIPPGQALAHMFAKAERLEPGKPADYDTRVSDWVRLRESGTYELRGRYVGVMPTQRPQLPRGLGLWRSAAESGPVRLTVLSAEDYLGQRDDRMRRRGVGLTVEGPSRLLPLATNRFVLRMENTGSEPKRVLWPAGVELWVLGPEGERVGGIPFHLEASYEELAIGPGSMVERGFDLESGRFEGERFGDYRLFVDLKAEGEVPRVPSNAVRVEWRLGPGDVRQLVADAARGGRTGSRNAALKLLRVHLLDVAEVLEAGWDGLEPAAAGLADQLRRAARLKPFEPKPGRVELEFGVAPDGGVRVRDGRLRGVFGAGDLDLTNAVGGVLAVRRHLGWDVGVRLEPEGSVAVGVALGVALRVTGFEAEFAGPVALVAPRGGTNGPALFFVRATPVKAGHLLVVESVGGVLRVRAKGENESAEAVIEGPEELARWLAERKERGGTTVVRAAPGIRWSDFIRALAPWIELGLGAELVGEVGRD